MTEVRPELNISKPRKFNGEAVGSSLALNERNLTGVI